MALLVRMGTAFLLSGLFIFFSLIPSPGMVILVSIATAILSWEYSKLVFYQKHFLFFRLGLCLICFLFYFYFFQQGNKNLETFFYLGRAENIFLIYGFLVASFWLVQCRGLSLVLDNIGFIFISLVYIAWPPAFFLKIFLYREYGLWELIFLMGVVFSGDGGAYLMGHFFGKKKWMFHISPHKTWLGLMSGLIVAGGSAVVIRWIYIQTLGDNFLNNTWFVLLFGVGIFFIAQTGDLLVSSLKRRARVKDTGSLLPGHGGLLDRLDGFLITLPFFYGILLSF